jgi:hypothetical protein
LTSPIPPPDSAAQKRGSLSAESSAPDCGIASIIARKQRQILRFPATESTVRFQTNSSGNKTSASRKSPAEAQYVKGKPQEDTLTRAENAYGRKWFHHFSSFFT